jgi:hypothetical protein
MPPSHPLHGIVCFIFQVTQLPMFSFMFSHSSACVCFFCFLSVGTELASFLREFPSPSPSFSHSRHSSVPASTSSSSSSSSSARHSLKRKFAAIDPAPTHPALHEQPSASSSVPSGRVSPHHVPLKKHRGEFDSSKKTFTDFSSLSAAAAALLSSSSSSSSIKNPSNF